ncbi:MAG: hypothetical protein PWQ37_775 [Candidatus Petromonas sp.]|jgi:hypothetical protein|nr:hypothetical protein [Candidatus Petromonas sp.]
MRIFGRDRKKSKNSEFTEEVLEKAQRITGKTTGELPGTPGLINKPRTK